MLTDKEQENIMKLAQRIARAKLGQKTLVANGTSSPKAAQQAVDAREGELRDYLKEVG